MDGTGGNSNSETSACFLRQLGERHHGPLQVIWAAHRGEAVREYLQTPGLGLVTPRLHAEGMYFIWDFTQLNVRPIVG